MKTKTLSEMIDVMKNHAAGVIIQNKPRITLNNAQPKTPLTWSNIYRPSWDWAHYHYRTKPRAHFSNKLFLHAPIMERDSHDGCWKISKFKYASKAAALDMRVADDNLAFWRDVRLPTLEESPTNVWLAPWDELPVELNSMACIVVTTSNKVIVRDGVFTFTDDELVSWDDIKAIMLLDLDMFPETNDNTESVE